MNTKVWLIDYSRYLDIGDFPIIINFNINDINIPSQRTSEFSNQFSIPGTKDNNITFDHIYNTGHSVLTFDPNIKIGAVVYVDDIEQIRGYLKYVKSTTDDIFTNDIVEYTFEFYGERIDFLEKLKSLEDAGQDKYIRDLTRLSSFTHSYTKDNIVNSWNNVYTDCYVYPMIDYGTSGIAWWMNNGHWKTVNLNIFEWKPALFARWILDEIFYDAGYTYTSEFLNSDAFNKMILPYNKKEIIFENQLSDFMVGLSASGVLADSNIQIHAGQIDVQIIAPTGRIPFNLESGTLTGAPLIGDAVLFDNFNHYNPTNFIYESTYGGDYSFYYQINFSFDFYTPTVFGTASLWENVIVELWLCDFFSTTKIPVDETLIEDGDIPLGGKIYTISGDTTIPVSVGVFYYLELRVVGDVQVTFFQLTETTTLNIHKSVWGSNDAVNIKNNQNVKEGNVIDFNTLNGFDMTQRAFLGGLTDLFNLYYNLIPGTKTFIIEPRDSFYTSDIVEWDERVDATTIEQKVIYNSDVDLKYTDDKDLYNEKYVELYNINYGEYIENSNGDFSDTFKIENVFSPTPFRSSRGDQDIILSVIVGENKEPIDHRQRILFYEGMQFSSTNFKFNGVTYSTYPRATHLENAFGATGLDLNYTFTKPFYSSIGGVQFTLSNQNLYNVFWKSTIEEVVGSNSRLLSGKVNLNSLEISDLSFRSLYRLKDNLYRLNSLQYNATNEELSAFELIRIQNIDSDVVTGATVVDGTDPGLLRKIDPNNTITGFPNSVNGVQNVINGNNLTINGNSNVILGTTTIVNGDSNTAVVNGSIINGSYYTPNSNVNNIILNVGDSEFKNYFDRQPILREESIAFKDGNLYVAGQFGFYDSNLVDGIVSISATYGTYNSEFSTTFSNAKSGNKSAMVNSILIYNNYIILGGSFENGLAVLSLTGSIVNNDSFKLNVGFTASKDNYVNTLFLDGDDLYVGGNFNGFISSTGSISLTRPNIAKVDLLNMTASTWGNVNGLNDEVSDIAKLTADSIIATGDFTLVGTASANYIVALDTGVGDVYSTFSYGIGFDNHTSKVYVDTTYNDVYVGGAFSLYDSYTNYGLIKLTATGSINSTFSCEFQAYVINSSYQNVVDLIIKDDSIYVFGQFYECNGYKLDGMAVIDRTTGDLEKLNYPELVARVSTIKGEFAGYDNSGITSALDLGDSLVLAGNFSKYNNLDYKALIKVGYGLL